jgi:hypothetical protein
MTLENWLGSNVWEPTLWKAGEIILFEILKPSPSFLKMKKMKLKNHDKSYTLLKNTLNSMIISKTRELPNTQPNQKAVMQVYL